MGGFRVEEGLADSLMGGSGLRRGSKGCGQTGGWGALSLWRRGCGRNRSDGSSWVRRQSLAPPLRPQPGPGVTSDAQVSGLSCSRMGTGLPGS